MTSPTQPDPTARPQPPTIRIHFELHPSPNGDGEVWVKCQIQTGVSTFAFIAAPEQAEQLASAFGNGFAQGAVEARRATLGLILPNQIPAEQLPHLNGHGLPAGGARPT